MGSNLCADSEWQQEAQIKSKLILYGADFRGFIQPIRYALFLAKISYKQVKFVRVEEFRQTFGKNFQLTSLLPLMEYGGVRLCYALPIVSYILRITNRTDLLGSSMAQTAETEDLLRTVYDLMWKVKDHNLNKKIKQNQISFMQANFPLYQALLGTCNQTFLGGKKEFTVADLFFFQLTFWMEGVFQGSISEDLVARGEAYQTRFKRDPRIRPYIDSLYFMERPFFCPEAYWLHRSITSSVK